MNKSCVGLVNLNGVTADCDSTVETDPAGGRWRAVALLMRVVECLARRCCAVADGDGGKVQSGQ